MLDSHSASLCHAGERMLHLAGTERFIEQQKVTLTLWYWNRSIDDKLIAKAKEKFPNIELTAQKIGGDFKAKLKTTLAARSGEPDIVALNDWIMELFPSEDRFYNLYDLGAGDVEDQYLDWKWKQGVTPGGQMIGFHGYGTDRALLPCRSV